MFMIPLGLSSGAAVLVSQALGAHRPREAVVIGWVGIGMGSLFMAFSGIVLYFFADPILNLFTQDAQVIVLGKKLLLVAAFFQLSDGIQVSCCGVLRGIGNTRASLAANFFGHWAIGLPIGYYLCFKNIIPSMSGALGLWVGLSIGLTFVAFVLLLEWFKKSNRIYLEN
jgi:MATE family multidrug resistance protein